MPTQGSCRLLRETIAEEEPGNPLRPPPQYSDHLCRQASQAKCSTSIPLLPAVHKIGSSSDGF